MKNVRLERGSNTSEDFIALVAELDTDLAIRDGRDHAFYSKFNTIEKIPHALVLYSDNKPVACGALREYEPGTVEVKRMYTTPEYRGNGFARMLLEALEEWARELSYQTCILETGKWQPEALKLYRSSGYEDIPAYAPYRQMENSFCFEKKL